MHHPYTNQMNLYKQIESEILAAEHIVITSHKSPDGDSVGSSLGLLHFIEKLGRKAFICHADPAPDFLLWMEGSDNILTMHAHADQVEDHFKKADLIFCLDYNATNRVGEEVQPFLEGASCKKIMIDHHLHPEAFADITISEPQVCSTAQLIYELIEHAGHAGIVDEKIGTPLYLGILTDTGTFRFSNVEPRTHEILGKLLAAGVPHHLVHENLNDNNTLNRVRLHGYAMSEKLELVDAYHTVIISLTEGEMARLNAQKGDTEGLVNVGLSIKGVKVSVFLAEKEGRIKMSFRSKGTNNPVNILAAEHFDGGGHANASGGVSTLPMLETIKKLKGLLPVYFGEVE